VRFIQGDGVNSTPFRTSPRSLRARAGRRNLELRHGRRATATSERDTLKFALKCSAVDRNGQWHNVYKNPKTDPSKTSKGGRFNLIQNGKDFATSKSLTALPSRPTTLSKRFSKTATPARPNSAAFAPSLLLTTPYQ